MRALRSRVPGFAAGILFLGLGGCQELSEPDLPGGGPSFARAEAETTVEVRLQDFPITGFCPSEEVLWTGKVILVFHETTNRGAPSEGFQHLVEVVSVHLTGTGLSGNTYLLNSRFNNSMQSPDPVDPFPSEFTVSFREQVISPAGGVIGLFTFTFKFVINGAGEVVIEEGEATGECQ